MSWIWPQISSHTCDMITACTYVRTIMNKTLCDTVTTYNGNLIAVLKHRAQNKMSLFCLPPKPEALGCVWQPLVFQHPLSVQDWSLLITLKWPPVLGPQVVLQAREPALPNAVQLALQEVQSGGAQHRQVIYIHWEHQGSHTLYVGFTSLKQVI